MVDHQDVIYNVTGQSFYLDCPEGRPTSITSVTVLDWNAGDDDTAESATTGSAGLDAVNTTFDAASGAGQTDPRKCNLTATTSIEVGRQYLAVGANKFSEWVEILSIASADSVITRVPLQNAYASADTFVGTRISISVLTSWIQDENKITDGTRTGPGYRVRWVYVITPPGGVAQTVVRYSYADVVRRVGVHNVTPADMESFVGNWKNILPVNHRADEGRALIQEGYRLLKSDLTTLAIPDQQLRDQDMTDELVKRAANLILQRSRVYGGTSDMNALELAASDYNSLLDRAVKFSTNIPIGVNDSGAGADVSAGNVWSR